MTVLQGVSERLRGQQTGGELDWESVYRAELPRVLNFFRYRVRDTAIAEDLTSTTFEKAWAGRQRYQDSGKFSAWLMTIARNVATDYFRTSRHHLPLDAASDREDGRRPETAAELKDERERLRRMLAGLPPEQQELVALKYGAELSNREIARLIGMSESNVGTTLHRVVGQLRLRWGAEK
jgi:RNA polymerase sigma-70 factor (ECF subfamily)